MFKGLESLNKDLKISYTVGIDSPFEEFFIPCLKNSKYVNICSGFFSSKLIQKIIPHSYDFFNRGGHIRLICGFIYPEDAKILIKNKEDLQKLLVENVKKEIDEILNLNCKEIFAYLLLKDLIEIKFAVIVDKNGFLLLWKNQMMHEKFGYFKDNFGKVISFSGSINYTKNAWFNNMEEFKVFNNFEPIKEDYCKIDIDKFEKYWNFHYLNNKLRLLIQEFSKFPEKVKKKILTKDLYKKVRTFKDLDLYTFNEINIFDEDEKEDLELRGKDLKMEDINGWLKYTEAMISKIETIIPRKCQMAAKVYARERNYKGILSMATGSGKTIAALLIIYELIRNEQYKGKLVIISVPDKYLVEQWYGELKNFYNPYYIIKASSEEYNWKKKAFEKIASLNINNKIKKQTYSIFIIGVSKSLNKVYKEFEEVSKCPIIFVGDEIHSLGSPVNIKYLRKFNPDYKIGLSATPIRKYDEEGTEKLLTWYEIDKDDIENEIYHYSIKEAQEDGILEKFSYYPILVDCSDTTFRNFEEISKTIKQKAMGNSEEIIDYRNLLLIQRAAEIKTEENKDEALINILIELLTKKKLFDGVVYCLKGTQIERINTKLKKQIKDKGLKLRENTIDGSLDNVMRKKYINSLTAHNMNFLYAMKVLDQGVDIPSLNLAFFVSSSSTEREHIQRAGRVLRKIKDKEKDVRIYDFLVIPTQEQISNNPEIAELIFEIEKRRYEFFTNISKNREGLDEIENDLLNVQDNILDSLSS